MSLPTIEQMPRNSFGLVKPTARQMRILELIDDWTRTHGYPPTIRQLQAATNAKSPNAIAQKLSYLRRKGWVTWEPHQARTVRITFPLPRSA